jgi:hypothetical protein
VINQVFTARNRPANVAFDPHGHKRGARKRTKVMLRSWIMGGTASALLSIATIAAAHAAPLGSAGEIRAAVQETSAVEKIAARRCWWRNGERHCSRARHVRPREYYPYYGRPRPEEFRTGSTAWWRAMDEEGRGGHGRNP